MGSVEEFMIEFFRDRLLEEQRYQRSRLPFRKRFFSDDCWYDSRADTLRRLESEKIVSIDEKKPDSAVITEQTLFDAGGVRTMRFRYHLQAVNEGWVIREVLIACVVCGGQGDANCPYCKGRHWINSGRSEITTAVTNLFDIVRKA
jgi:hypothetical protein